MLVSPFPPFILDQSTSYLECKTLRMVINFLVLWLICLGSSLVNFRNGLQYLRGVQPRSSSILEGPCSIVWFREVFLFSWDTLFNFLISSPHFLMCQHLIIVNTCTFLHPRPCECFPYLVVPFLLSCVLFRVLLLALHIFLYQISPLYPDSIYSMRVYVFLNFILFWQSVWCRLWTISDWYFLVIYLVCIN